MLELNNIYNMDCIEGMKLIEDNSVDSIVTDPPYGLSFMGKEWDSFNKIPSGFQGASPANENSDNPFFKQKGQTIKEAQKGNINFQMFCGEWAKECLRILKPGGHLLAFGGTRTYHRMAVAIEDAGFEIRDQMQWIYGSGFPKSMNISKAMDKKAGAEREVVGKNNSKGIRSGQNNIVGDNYTCDGYNVTIPNSTEAKEWDGWGTALKPANEPIVVARKPLSEKTVVENVLKWGTGGINIDGCRIPLQSAGEDKRLGGKGTWSSDKMAKNVYEGGYSGEVVGSSELGRFPANIIFDEESVILLDEQTGIKKSTRHMSYKRSGGDFIDSIPSQSEKDWFISESGGASRFFYCAKASKSERGEENIHPTVKPIKLIEYLIKLVTPPNGICVDPFMGSGTTAVSAVNNNIKYIGFELDENYYNLATERIKNHKIKLALQADL